MTLQTLKDDTIQTVTKFFASPEGKAITAKAIADQQAAVHAERLQLVAEQARLHTRELAAIAAHDKQDAPLVARIADLERQLDAVRNQRQTIVAARGREQFTTAQALTRIEARLWATRGHEDIIEAFIADLTAQLDQLRFHADEVKSHGINGNLYQRWNNNASIFARQDAIVAAIRQARDLWREALTADEVTARLDAMRRLIPAVETRPDGWQRL